MYVTHFVRINTYNTHAHMRTHTRTHKHTHMHAHTCARTYTFTHTLYAHTRWRARTGALACTHDKLTHSPIITPHNANFCFNVINYSVLVIWLRRCSRFHFLPRRCLGGNYSIQLLTPYMVICVYAYTKIAGHLTRVCVYVWGRAFKVIQKGLILICILRSYTFMNVCEEWWI